MLNLSVSSLRRPLYPVQGSPSAYRSARRVITMGSLPMLPSLNSSACFRRANGFVRAVGFLMCHVQGFLTCLKYPYQEKWTYN